MGSSHVQPKHVHLQLSHCHPQLLHVLSFVDHHRPLMAVSDARVLDSTSTCIDLLHTSVEGAA